MPRLIAVLLLLLALATTGCGKYYDAIEKSNMYYAQNPRVAKIKLEPKDPNKPMVVQNASIEAEIPLDAWRKPMEPESPGETIAKPVRAASSLSALWGRVFGGNGGDNSVSYSQVVSGQGAGGSIGGRDAMANPATSEPTVVMQPEPVVVMGGEGSE